MRVPKALKTLIFPALTALVLNSVAVVPAVPGHVSGSTTRLISATGTTRLHGTPTGSAAVQFPELRGEPEGETGDEAEQKGKPDIVNRSHSPKKAPGSVALPAANAAPADIDPDPGVDTTFAGLNHFDQRTANNGNQFSLEPPDQGLCVANGFVLETINDVLRVYTTNGTPVTGVMDQNTFNGYSAAFQRPAGPFGPFVTDPSCYYDVDTNTWFHVVLTLDVDPATGDFTGGNHLDLAVHTGDSPVGDWKIYTIPVENDGTHDQPNHHCSGGPCIGDYPHIGADANGFYITTNEYSFFGPEFKSANIYAFSKSQLAAAEETVNMQQFDTEGLDGGNPGFTIWPAISPAGIYADDTAYFLSSNAAEEANGDGTSNDLLTWALTNTSSLDTTPDLTLSHASLNLSMAYSTPPKADQKPGSIPLGDCLNDRTTKSALWQGAGCWRALFLPQDKPKAHEVESMLDSNDTRMQQVVLADGRLWGALDTAVSVDGEVKAGIAFFTVEPSTVGGEVQATLVNDGTLGVAGNNLTYPAVAVTPDGAGVMAFTAVGADFYPSAGWAPIDASGVGDVHVVSQGLGPSDGFTSYKAFVGNPPRTRWGDYGAAVVAGDSIWIASESIEQTCTFSQLVASAFTCANTRTALANWATRISKVTP
jgi:hypothetical protein